MAKQSRVRGAVMAIALMVVSAVVTGCGSNSSSSSADASKLTGTPIKLWVISFVNTPFGTEPGPFAGAQGAARAINAAGGVNGHPIDVTTCNSQYQPSVELACARQAVSGGATAVVGSLAFINSPANLAVWQQANLANVGSLPTVPQDFVSPINFPLTSFLQSVACVTLFPKAAGVTKLGSPQVDLAIAHAGYTLDQAAAAKVGTDVFSALVPNTASDMTPYVEQLATKGANGIFLGLDPAKSPEFIKAASSLGKTWPYCHSDGVMTGGQLLQLGSSAVGKFYEGAVVPPLTATAQYPELKTFIAQMVTEKAAGDSAADTSVTNYAANMLQSWLAVQAVAQVARTIKGPINHTTFLAQIRKSTVSFGGIIPSIDFAKPNPHPGFSQLFNPYVLLVRWDPARKNFYLVPGVKPFDAVAAVAP